MIHVQFLNTATDDEAGARLGRLLAGLETEADIAAITPFADGPAPGERPRAGQKVRDPRTLPGWRPGYRQVGQGAGFETVGADRA